jgi:subtilase family serine protease
MRRLGTLFRFTPAIAGVVVVMSGCSGGAAGGTSAGSTSERTATTGQAIVASGGTVDFRHVKGVRQAPGKAGAPPTDADCRAKASQPCYSPQEIQAAYGVSALLADGFDGKGETIVIVDSFGSPTIADDLKQFAADYGLPDPPSFQVIAPLGTVPFDPTSSDMQGWAFETTLDVEWAHALAPGANIVLLTSPVSETEGTVGMPELLQVETYALDHHLGHVISQSWGATENTLFDDAGRQVVSQFEALYKRARAEHVTVFASAGDSGSSNAEQDGVTYYPFPTVGYPASSPYVTAVGGTSLTADTSGNYGSEVVWDDNGAGGGGVSQTFAEPGWQRLLPASVQRQLSGHRGLPDVSYNADPATAILVYLGIPGVRPGYYFIGGTSEGSPQWAGIAADFNQIAGRPLGFLSSKLYLLGAVGALAPLSHDITVGNNGLNGVPGYSATPGWDLATGWGTPKLGDLGRALAALPDDDDDAN